MTIDNTYAQNRNRLQFTPGMGGINSLRNIPNN